MKLSKRSIVEIVNFDELYDYAKNKTIVFAFEHHVYNVAKRLTENANEENKYNGGIWKSVRVGEVFHFRLDDKKIYDVLNPNNGFSAQLSAKSFSFVVWLIALSEYSMHIFRDYKEEEELLNVIVFVHTNLSKYLEELTGEEKNKVLTILD